MMLSVTFMHFLSNVYGCLGIQNPTETAADREYHASKEITKQLIELICDQNQNLSLLDHSLISKIKAEFKKSYSDDKMRLLLLTTSKPKKSILNSK